MHPVTVMSHLSSGIVVRAERRRACPSVLSYIMAETVQNSRENNGSLVRRIFELTAVGRKLLIGIDRYGNDVQDIFNFQGGSLDQGMKQAFNKELCCSTVRVPQVCLGKGNNGVVVV